LFLRKKADSVEKSREQMITPKNLLFKANPLKQSAVSPVTVPESLGLLQKLNNSDSNMFNNLEYNHNTPPSIYNENIDVAPSPPCNTTDIECEQSHQDYPYVSCRCRKDFDNISNRSYSDLSTMMKGLSCL
jgi:hypothetical protein